MGGRLHDKYTKYMIITLTISLKILAEKSELISVTYMAKMPNLN